MELQGTNAILALKGQQLLVDWLMLEIGVVNG